jgi:drug/metabolite transporter (DMT)-like permease
VHATGKAVAPLELSLLLLLGVLWGIPYALTKIALETIPPITLTAARVSLAAVTLWCIVLVLGRKLPRRWEFAGRLFIQGGLACVIPYTLIAFGQQSVDSALAAILNSATPLFVCLIAVMWTHHEPMTLGRIGGAMIGLGGVVLIAGASALAGLGREISGQAAILLATFASAFSVIYGRRFSDVAPEVVAAGALTCAAMVLVPLCLLVEAPWRAAPSAASLAALGANSIGATAMGFVIYFRLIRTIGSMGTASTGYLKPAVGVLIGCAMLAEPFTWTLAIGLAAILAGVATINGSVARLLDAFKRARSTYAGARVRARLQSRGLAVNRADRPAAAP